MHLSSVGNYLLQILHTSEVIGAPVQEVGNGGRLYVARADSNQGSDLHH